jgi:hypothetical protein
MKVERAREALFIPSEAREPYENDDFTESRGKQFIYEFFGGSRNYSDPSLRFGIEDTTTPSIRRPPCRPRR